MTEYPQHLAAKARIYKLVEPYEPEIIAYEYVYPNPNNRSGDPIWDWKFDVYFKIQGKEYAVEIDGKKGHNSKRSKEKRDFKKQYLEGKGIHLFAFATKWLIGRKALPDSVFIDELHLTKMPKQVAWFNM